MKKIPTIFKRNPDNLKEITPNPHPDCAWVFNGEGGSHKKIRWYLLQGFKRSDMEKEGTKIGRF